MLLRTFGGLSLVGDALPPAATQRRRLALLVLLARAGERGVSRDKLLAYLWPESPSESARHALDQLLYATRRDLGRDAILADGSQLRLNGDRIGAECTEFERHLERGEFESAVSLYAGPFLDGVHLADSVEFERWLDGERAELHEKFVGLLERLAGDAAARGDTEAAVSWWRRCAAAEPLNARVALRLMRALAEHGDPAGALRHGEVHARLVREELGGEPDPGIAEFARRVAAGIGPSNPASPGALPTPRAEPLSPTALPRSGSGNHPVPRQGVTPRPLGRAMAGGFLLALVLGIGVTWLQGRPATATSGEPDNLWGALADRAAPAATEEGTSDAVARSLYLRGRNAWNRRSPAGLEEAVVLFRQAAERDPTYAEAHAGLADAYVLLGYLGYVPGDAAFPKGRAAALRALALDPGLGQAYAALALALQWEGRWSEADRAFVRALDVTPDHATAHQWYALLLTILGRPEEALLHGLHAAELDPLSIQVQNTYAMMLFNAGRLDAALRAYERVVTHEPDTAWVRENPWVLANFARVLAAAGRRQDAVRMAETAVEAVPGHPRALYELATVHLAAGDRGAALAAFQRADTAHPHYPVYRAFLHARLGELDPAFDWLGRAEEWSPILHSVLSGNPSLAPLRADARYAELRRRQGLPEAPLRRPDG